MLCYVDSVKQTGTEKASINLTKLPKPSSFVIMWRGNVRRPLNQHLELFLSLKLDQKRFEEIILY